jgi:glutathione S-transferase
LLHGLREPRVRRATAPLPAPVRRVLPEGLVALYELDLAFATHLVEGDEGLAELAALWPIASMPVLRDDAAGLTLPESTTIIEYLDGFVAVARRPRPAAPGAP